MHVPLDSAGIPALSEVQSLDLMSSQVAGLAFPMLQITAADCTNANTFFSRSWPSMPVGIQASCSDVPDLLYVIMVRESLSVKRIWPKHMPKFSGDVAPLCTSHLSLKQVNNF